MAYGQEVLKEIVPKKRKDKLVKEGKLQGSEKRMKQKDENLTLKGGGSIVGATSTHKGIRQTPSPSPTLPSSPIRKKPTIPHRDDNPVVNPVGPLHTIVEPQREQVEETPRANRDATS